MTTLTIPLVTLQVGAITLGPETVADNEVKIVLTIDRTVAGGLNSLTPSSTVAINVSQSDDGGTTWQLNVGGTFPGGIINTLKAGIITASLLKVELTPGSSRQLKADVIVAGSAVTVAGTLVTT